MNNAIDPLPAPLALDGCPYLGLASDRATRAAFVDAAHRCYHTDPPSPVSGPHQAVFCLSDRYRTCSRFAPRAAATQGPAARRRLSLGPVIAAVGIAAVATAAAFIVVGNPFTVEHDTAAPAAQPAYAPAVGTETPGVATVATSPTLVAPTPPPAAATRVPSAAPAPQHYVVQPGDSLTSVARQFDVSVPALAAANGLAPGAFLDVGQTLLIPPAGASPTPAP